MFVQIIEGQTTDADGLARQLERWIDELRPGADGFIGATAGVTADGNAISLVRFDSAAAARRNSERADQGDWWTETEKYYDGDVTFTESADVTEWLAGGSDDAGFVQVMKSTGVDRAAAEEMDTQFGEFAGIRPDIIGGYRVWTGPGTCVEVAYFTSEAEARAGEDVEMPEDLQRMMTELGEAMGTTEYLDLVEPDLY